MKKPLVLLLLLVALPACADTIISVPISSDTTWSPSGGVYIIDSSFSVASGTTLTIEPGTIIKARITSRGGPSIYGRIVAQGTSDLPIYFTSIHDDSIGGDTLGGGPSTGVPGQWQGLYFKSGSTGSFHYANLSYAGAGGFGFGNFIGIENDGGTLDIRYSRINDNHSTLSGFTAGAGIRNKGSLSVSNSIIENQVFGILSEKGSVAVSGSVIKNNSERGIYANDGEEFTLLNNTFSGNKQTGQIVASINFVHEDNTSNDISSRGIERTGSPKDGSIWHSRDLPTLITQGHVAVPAGNTLTLEPGTIIKLGGSSGQGGIVVHGRLISKGTADNKIYITSLKDDSVGGDTNGDGGITLPAPRNWNAIFLENGSSAEFEHTVIKYSGYNFNGEYQPGVAAAIYNRGANLSMKDSFIGHNWGASIFQDAGTTNILHSELADSGYGIQSRGGSITIAQSSLHNHIDKAIYNQSVQVIDARHNWWGDPSGPKDTSTSTPTGAGDRIDGSILYVPFLTENPLTQKRIDPVIIIPGIMGSAYKNGQLVIDPILHTYDDLIATLIANGYTEGKDLFTFPYEWRDSNVFSANLLDDKIEEVKLICDCDKVDIVAHSMGGLVARSYIQSTDYDHDVDQIIFLGTPHKGAPTAYLQWEAGKLPNTFFDTLIELFFEAESLRNGYSTIFSYIHNKPILSVQELLPIFNYLKDKDTGIIREYPDNYPRDYFLENLNNNVPHLLNSGVEITNIVGNSGSDTIEKLRIVPSTHFGLWEHGELDGFYTVFGDQGLERGLGDNTVTIFGATLDNSIINQEISGNHQRIPTVAEARVFNILTDKVASTTFDNNHGVDKKVLLLQLLSPIDVVVTAPDGKKIGKNFSDSTEYNEIPLAFYSGFETDDEYITILNPVNGEYKVEIQGTNSGGEYGLLTSYVFEKFATTTKTIGITESGQITNLEVIVDNEHPEELRAEREITFEVLINDVNGAYNLGWIKDEKTRDELVKKIQKIYKNDKNTDKNLAKALSLDLKLYRKEKINEQVYNIIKTDLEWLINN